MAAPPSSPGYQASSMALALAFSQLAASALPFISTITRSLWVAATARSRSCSGLGISRLVHWHLLPFEAAGNTHHGNDDVSLLRGIHRCWIRRIVGRRPNELRLGL